MEFMAAAGAWLGSAQGVAATAAAATAVAAASAVSQRNTQKNIAEANAEAARKSAETERMQGTERQNALRRRIALITGTQNAAIAQSGTGFGGSAADVMKQSAINSEFDVLTTKYESELRARGFGVQAANEMFAGRRAAAAGRGEAIGSILSGAAQYGQYRGQRNSISSSPSLRTDGPR